MNALRLLLLVGMTSMGLDAREATAAAITRAARIDSSVFTDAFFGYRSAPFQQEWHREWSKVGARVVQWAPVEHGKTQQATGWALHRLGQDPVNARILWLGASSEAAQKSTGIIKDAIENQRALLRAVFPNLRPGTRKWTQSAFSVAGARATEKDYSVQTAGVGKQILGGRYTDIILDDVLNFDTTYTAGQRAKVVRWFFSTIPGRLLDGGRIICIGNAWYVDDLMHEMAERGYTVIRQAAYRETESGQIDPDSILWPAQWSAARLEEKRRELGTIEAMRQLLCVPYSPGQGRFLIEWFEKAMSAGREYGFVREYRGPWPTFAGFDLGVSKKEGSDKTAGWCIAVDPVSHHRRLLTAFEDRMTGPEIVARLKDWKQRYGPVTMVENNAAQDFIRQFAGADGVETLPFTTGKNKADPAFGVPSLGVELEQGLWILPCAEGDAEAQAIAVKWRTQCLAYSPGQHTGDLLMASWFAREAARRGGPALSVTSEDVDPDDDSGSSAPPRGGLRANYSRIRGGRPGR
jgi:hypothetical protein